MIATVLLLAGALPLEDPVDYAREVLPILSEHCLACHGPDRAAREGGLRLDVATEARATGVLEGSPAELVRRIAHVEGFELMPPPEAGKPLAADQIALLERWVAEGAPYATHWAFEAPERPEPPAVDDGGWARNPIDRFVLARLEASDLAPAPEADRRRLARRLSFDLTGLPPDPVEVEAFVQDASPDAYERLVERWLATPEWGEHRARYWLDLARYADTHGIHFDNYRDIWPYRDWVIDAFTRDLPFDRFSIQQLAGDLLPDATIEERVATGFLRCNTTTNEGGLIDEEYKVLYARDRTETFGQAWLGMSVGCAVCHDHKYDPLTQAEFYGLSAYFDNTTVPVRDGNIRDPGPILHVTPEQERPRQRELEAARDRATLQRDRRFEDALPELLDWLEGTGPAEVLASVPAGDEELWLPLSEGQGRNVAARVRGVGRAAQLAESAGWADDGPLGPALKAEGGALELVDVADFDSGQAFTSSAWVRVRRGEPTGALWSRMDTAMDFRGWDVWLQGRRVGTHVIHHFPNAWLKVVAADPLPADTWVHVSVSYDGSQEAEGVAIYYDGVPQPLETVANSLVGSSRTEVPFRLASRTGSGATGPGLFDLRIDARVLAPGQVDALAHSAALAAARDGGLDGLPEGARMSLRLWWSREQDADWQALNQEVEGHGTALRSIEQASPTAHVFTERASEPMAHVLDRGEYDRRLAQVSARTPAFLSPSLAGGGSSRLDLARWLFEPNHPLTARVAVNRYWQEVFGRGLVRTAGDFGLAGEHPSHPLLLDWLAVEFQEGGWSTKQLFRTIVTSATYRQSARVDAATLQQDPDNRLLSRGPRFRMDAEMIRDAALSASGLLVREVGGPSVKPYQPPGVWEAIAMRESNTHDYVQDSGSKLWRRSLYTFWKRSAPPASMEIFDAPSREICTVRRERTNTPLQALVTLNDPQFVEAARSLAALALRQGGTEAARLDWIMARVTARPMEAGERKVVQRILADLQGHYRSEPGAAALLLSVGESDSEGGAPDQELAAWTMLTNMLMNLDEVVTK